MSTKKEPATAANPTEEVKQGLGGNNTGLSHSEPPPEPTKEDGA